MSFPHDMVRRDFERILKDHAMWALYVRKDARFPCLSCFNPATQQGDVSCDRCFGMFYEVRLARVPTRIVHNPLQSKSVGEQNLVPGFLGMYPAQLYVARNVYPAANDLLIECEWDVGWSEIGARGYPVKLSQVWELRVLGNQNSGPLSFWEAALQIYDYNDTRLERQLLSSQHAIETILPESW